ncbi:MAG: MerR family transcriptional regulator, partial [Calditrichaeota bacterium]|nr:MerR family transcriptional regulator [Calditrichota bacterium]
WESEFAEINPKKNNAGIRRYSKDDIEIIHRIKQLLHDEKYTIKGAKSVLSGEAERLDQESSETQEIRQDLLDLRTDIERMINFIDASISNQKPL